MGFGLGFGFGLRPGIGFGSERDELLLRDRHVDTDGLVAPLQQRLERLRRKRRVAQPAWLALVRPPVRASEQRHHRRLARALTAEHADHGEVALVSEVPLQLLARELQVGVEQLVHHELGLCAAGGWLLRLAILAGDPAGSGRLGTWQYLHPSAAYYATGRAIRGAQDATWRTVRGAQDAARRTVRGA